MSGSTHVRPSGCRSRRRSTCRPRRGCATTWPRSASGRCTSRRCCRRRAVRTHGYDVVDFARSTRSAAGSTAGRACWPRPPGARPGHRRRHRPEPHRRRRRRARTRRGGTCSAWVERSPYARWFDIDWSRGRLLLPVLGDDFDPARDLIGRRLANCATSSTASRSRPGTEPAPGDTAAEVHDRQHYELVNYRRGRRRAELPALLRRVDACRAAGGGRGRVRGDAREIAALGRDDGVAGLRIDHPDGLADPLGYLSRLRAAGRDTWMVVEKILEPGEALPAELAGRRHHRLRRAGRGRRPVRRSLGRAGVHALYRALTGDRLGLRRARRGGQAQRRRHDPAGRGAAAWPGSCPRIEHADDALAELLVAFPVYRSYLPDGAEHLAAAVEACPAARPDLADAIDSSRVAAEPTRPTNCACGSSRRPAR